MPNAADRRAIREAEKQAKLDDQNRREVVVAIAETIPGRKWLYDKLASASVFATTFNPDTTVMAFNEGQRNQGLVLLHDILEACPDQFIQMMREANARRTDTAVGERSSGEDPDGGDQDDPGEYHHPGLDLTSEERREAGLN